MHTEIVEVNAEKAKFWLETNTSNRKLNRRTVIAYARDMATGNYALTHQGIGFFADGTLADGQHRLNAVIEADVTVPMLVVYGIEKTPHIDRLRSRSISDCLMIEGNGWIDKNVVAIISAIDVKSRERASLSRTKEVAEKYKSEIQFVVSLIGKRQKGISHASVAGAAVAALVCGVSASVIERFYQVLISGVVEQPYESSVIRLRDILMTKTLTGGGTSVRQSIYLKSQRVIKAMNSKERLSKIYMIESPIYELPAD